jgi:hypothetical protein
MGATGEASRIPPECPRARKNEDEILDCYVAGCRKKFKLTKKDGITDSEFFGRG